MGGYRSDPEQLKKFKNLFLELYQTQTLFNKYFSYGNQKVSFPQRIPRQSAECRTKLTSRTRGSTPSRRPASSP